MTRRISLIIGTAVAALVMGVPVASADDWFADRQQQSDFWNYDQAGRKIADTSPGVQAGDLAGLYSTPSDASVQQAPVLRRSAQSVVAPAERVVTVSDGDATEWAEIGIGLGVGVLLGLGLLFGLGGVRPRPLAH